MKISAFLILIVFVCFYSCNCGSGCAGHDYQFSILLEGYTDSEVTPVILKSYLKNSNFSSFIDSTVYSDLANGNSRINDTIQHLIETVQGNDSTDYLLSLPKAGVTYRVTNLVYQLVDCGNCGKHQIPSLKTYVLNGGPPIGHPLGATGDMIIYK